MKKTLGLFLFSCCFSALQAQYTIPDPEFAAKLRNIVPNAMDGDTLDETHPEVTGLLEMDVSYASISDLDGIQFFIALDRFHCDYNSLQSLGNLPNSITRLYCSNNQLPALGTIPSGLEILDCSQNMIGLLGGLPSGLEFLNCGGNQIAFLPALPAGLTYLDCSQNPTTSFPPLPMGLLEFWCWGSQLTGLPNLPPTIEILSCGGNQIQSLPTLPPDLVHMDCSYNEITSFPPLPSGVEIIYAFQNELYTLPILPNSLRSLDVGSNNLTALPFLNSLEALSCFNNNILSLPLLPSTLTTLTCAENPITILPPLPDGLVQLECYNAQLDCLPLLPDGLVEMDCFGNNISCLPNIPSSFNTGISNLGFPLTVCNVVNTLCPLNDEAITGSVFHDDNGNGIKDGGEAPFLLSNVEAQPGDYLTAPDASGNFVLPIAEGTFTLEGQDVLYHLQTTPPANITLGPLEVDSLNHIGYQIIPDIYDLVADISAQPARPGFDNTLWLNVENIGTESTTANIELDFDADQSWVGSNEVPDSQAGNNATWSPILAPGDSWSSVVTLNTAVNVPLGTAINHTLTALPQQTDTTLADNTATINTEVVGSYDPNDKLIEPAFMTMAELQTGMPIEYTIRFQNTGTFMAERVVITDTLSADLEWNTMDFVSSSHSSTWYIQDSVLHFIFEDIFLPDSTSDEANSHGFVKFRMQPSNQLLPGSTIENVANIYFDFNVPVITEPAVFEVETSIEVGENEQVGFSLWPNPATGTLWLRLADRTPSNIDVLDLAGKVLVSAARKGAQEQMLDIRGLRSGVYFVRVSNAEGVQTARFVKF